MAENQVKRFPFSNKGMVQKLDVNQLDDGQYTYLLNMVSQQEGSLSPRNGYADVATTWGSADHTNVINDMLVSRDNAEGDPTVYLGIYDKLSRRNTDGSLTSLAVGILGSGAVQKRIGMAQFKTQQLNSTGTVYFASGYNNPDGSFRGMLRDDGHYTQARVNGILPPVVPAFPSPAVPTIVKVGGASDYTDSRLTATISSATRDTSGLGLGSIAFSENWDVVVSSVSGMQVGMYINYGPTTGFEYGSYITAINATTNTITFTSSPTPSGFINASQTPDANPIPVTGTGGTSTITLASPVNLAMSGTAETSYDSDDLIHLSFYSATPEFNKSLSFRLYSGSGYQGYYEYQITLNETAPPTGTAGYWIEYDIPKTAFTKNGVGSGDYSWANITAAQLTIACFDSSEWHFAYGQIFGHGGGGPNSSSSGAFIPYDYVYTFLDPQSGAESNPSQLMSQASGVYVSSQNINIIIWGGPNSGYDAGTTRVAVYRRGGTFTDGIFRRVGLIDNPGVGGSYPNAGLFVDTISDSSLINAKQVSFDNDAPVTSDLNKQYIGTISASGGPFSKYITVTPVISGVTDLRTVLTAGTQILVGGGVAGASNNQETCTISDVTTTTFKTFFVYSHLAGEQISWSTNAGVAGDLIMAAMDCLWMAGDPNNPHMLYRSKTGQPESWPVINDLTGNAHQLAISSPDNPIMGLAEFNGEIVCLCKNSIFTVRMDSGVMRGPLKAPSNRGLFKKAAWGYVDNAIWFLAYDGIYAWNGSSIQKVSFAVDFIFNNKESNGILPYDQTQNSSKLVNIQQKGNDVFINYYDTAQQGNVLRYNLLFDRWSIEQIYDSSSVVTDDKMSNVSCLFMDKTSGDMYGAKATLTASGAFSNILIYDKQGQYTDGSSQKIKYQASSKFYDMGAPFTKKNFTDLATEITSGHTGDSTNTFNVDLLYDYASTSSETVSVSSTVSRHIDTTPINIASGSSAGREARVLQWKISGYSSYLNYWHSLGFGFVALSDLTKGRVTDWSDLGHPYDKRLTEVTIEYDNSNSAVDLYLDTVSGIEGKSYNAGIQTLTLPAAVGRSKITLAVNDSIIAKLVRLRPVVASAQYQIFDFKFVQENYPADRMFFTDYSDLGYQYEKRFYQLYINCDTNGQSVSVDIEGDGSVLQTVTVSGTAANRMQAIPLNKDLIARLIRLKVSASAFSNANAKFQLFDFKFDYENLPKPIVLSTPWTDFGYNYNKFAEQIAFDVNTNNQPVKVKIFGDGNQEQEITIISNQQTRSVNVTLNPGIIFQMMRLELDPDQFTVNPNARFQLWEYTPIYRPYDKGAVYHTFDWDDLGHPYDKKISEVTVEFETGHSTDNDLHQDTNIILAIDTLTGIDGKQQNLAAIQLQIPNTSQGRGYKTFPLPETVCKMIRIRSLGQDGLGLSQNANFKMWGYKFGGTIPYPADISLFTEWNDAGSPCAKIFRGVGLQIDTNGVNCDVYLDVDGTSAAHWVINTNSTTRQIFLSQQSGVKQLTGSTGTDNTSSQTTSSSSGLEINGYLYRLRFAPGTNGKSQLFQSPEWDLVKDACDFTVLDTYPQAFGSAGYTVIKQIWADYKCDGEVRVKIYNEDGDLFYTQTLPAHSTRAAERFYVPSVYGGVINKSKKHRIIIESVDPTKKFRWYRDSSRVEYLNLSADQRKGYYQFVVWEQIKIPV